MADSVLEKCKSTILPLLTELRFLYPLFLLGLIWKCITMYLSSWLRSSWPTLNCQRRLILIVVLCWFWRSVTFIHASWALPYVSDHTALYSCMIKHLNYSSWLLNLNLTYETLDWGRKLLVDFNARKIQLFLFVFLLIFWYDGTAILFKIRLGLWHCLRC